MDLTAAAYQATEGGPLDVDRDFYRAIANDKGRELVESLVLPIDPDWAFCNPVRHNNSGRRNLILP